MINKTFALVRRALRVDSRDLRPHLFRCALAGIILFTLMTIQLEPNYRSAPGRDLFTWVMYYNYWFITAAGATFFATAITEEKEERTLSLMKMAGVGATAVLAGKWIPRLIGAFLLILIQIPFTALAITLGGVLWQQVGAAYIALLAHLFFVGNIGLLASVIRPTMSGASGLTIVLVFLYHVAPYIVSSAVQAMRLTSTWSSWLGTNVVYLCDKTVESCALWRLSSIMVSGFNESFFSFQVISNLIAGSVLLFLAWLFFEPCTRNEVDTDRESALLTKARHFGSFGTERRSWDAALIWKDYHYLAGGTLVLLLKFCAYFLLVFGLAMFFSDWNISRIDLEDLGWTAWSLGLCMIILETAVVCTRVYRQEMTKQTWSLLTMLPMPLASVSYSKLTGAMIAVVPAFCCFASSVILMPDEVGDIVEDILTEADVFLGVSYFILQVFTAIHLGTYLSITSRWAVWPLAIFMGAFAVFMWNFMFIICMNSVGGGGEEGILFLMDCMFVVIIIVLHIMIGRRLAVMASE